MACSAALGACSVLNAPGELKPGVNGGAGGGGSNPGGGGSTNGGGGMGATGGGGMGATGGGGGTPLVCGDGILHPDEDCDDGNSQNGDGCSDACAVTEFDVAFDATIGNEFPGIGPSGADGGNGFLVSWRKLESNGNKIEARQVTSTGELVGTMPLNLSTQGNPGLPQIGTNADGRSMVAWTGAPGGDNKALVRYRIVEPSGSLKPSSLDLVVPNSDAQGGGLVTVGASVTKSFAFGWAAYDGPTGISSFRLQAFDAAGDPVGGSNPITFTIDQAQGFVNGYPGPGIWPLKTGFMASWNDDSGLLYSCPLGNDGQVNGNCFDLAATGGGFNINPAGAYVGPNDEFIAVWEKNLTFGGNSKSRVVSRRFNGAGLPVAEETAVSSNHRSEFQTRVARHTNGRFLVVWVDCEATADPMDTCRVMARMFEGNGQPVGFEWRVNQDSKGAQTWPGVAVNPLGDVMIVWDNNPGDVPYHITGIIYPRLMEKGPPA
jgi:cysteine-rich repeat protein